MTIEFIHHFLLWCLAFNIEKALKADARAWKHFEQEQLMVNEARRENVATAMRRIGSGFGPGRVFKLRIVDAELLQVGIET